MAQLVDLTPQRANLPELAAVDVAFGHLVAGRIYLSEQRPQATLQVLDPSLPVTAAGRVPVQPQDAYSGFRCCVPSMASRT